MFSSCKRIKYIIPILLLVGIFICFKSQCVEAKNTYYIYNAEDLWNIRNDMTGRYFLMNDIDLDDILSEQGNHYNQGKGWLPIGSDDYKLDQEFSGEFYGNGYTINNFSITYNTESGQITDSNDYNYLGLFAKNTGIIKNVCINGAITNTNKTEWMQEYIGSITACNSGEIYNVKNNCDMNINDICTSKNGLFIGGVCGYNQSEGKISQCDNTGNIESKFNYIGNSQSEIIGGIVGLNYGEIKQCKNSGPIKGGYSKVQTTIGSPGYQKSSGCAISAGGIVGRKSQGTIRECYNIANIFAYVYGNTENKTYYWTGYFAYAGGIVGSEIGATSGLFVNENKNPVCGVQDCYNTGDIESTCRTYETNEYSQTDSFRAYAGGIAGTTSLIERCFNTGKIRHSFMYDIAKEFGAGVICGLDLVRDIWAPSDDYYKNYYTYSLSGKGRSNSSTKTLAEGEMKYRSHYEQFDFGNIWYLDDESEYGYPQLKNNRQDGYKNIIDDHVVSAEIIQIPNKTTYHKGEKLDFTGSSVKLSFVDGKQKTVTMNESMIANEIDMDTVGDYRLSIEIDDSGKVWATGGQIIHVLDSSSVSDIRIVSYPNKTEFLEGTHFDFSEFKVIIEYEDGLSEVKRIDESMVSGCDINVVGEQVATYSQDGKSVSINVTVLENTKETLRVSTLPNNRVYLENTPISTEGMKLTLTYANGKEEVITGGWTVYYSTKEVGVQPVRVVCAGLETTYNITVKAKSLQSIYVYESHLKDEYVIGQTISKESLIIYGKYDNGQTDEITDFTIDSLPNKVGEHTIYVRYGKFKTEITVKVIKRELQSIYISKYPNKMTYVQGTAFDKTGMVIKGVFNDDTEEDIEDYTMSQVNTNNVGENTVSIEYNGFELFFEINVIKKELIGIKVADDTKTSFLLGEELKPSDIVVLAQYNDDSVVEVNGFTIDGFTGEIGNNTIVISYLGKEFSYTVTVHEPRDEWSIIENPTCTKTGKRVKYCKHCGEVAISEELKAKGHTIIEDKSKDATCTESGLTQGFHCSDCGEVLVEQEIISPKGHDLSEEWEPVKDASCVESGSRVKRCKRCNEIVETDVIEAKGHKLVTDNEVPATCTEPGLTEGLHCEVCDEVIQAQTIIQPLGHIEEEEWTVSKAPTCTVAGTKVKKCTVCGHILKTEIIDPIGHLFKNYISNNDATCTEDGTKTAKCEHCSETKTITDVDSAKGHKVVYDKAVAATCVESGLTEGSHCSNCNVVFQRQEVVAPKGHTESSTWIVSKESTCTEKGIEVRKCVECGETLDSRKIEARGHTEVTDGAVDASCEKTGLTQGSHCKTCGEILKKQEIIPAKGHFIELKHTSKATYFDKGYTGDEVCNICGQVLKHGETISKVQVPKSIVKFKKGKKKITLKFTKQKLITKYEIRIKKGKKWKVYFTNKKTYRLKKLKKKKKYTIKVRALIIRDSRTAYSKFITKKVKTK